MSKGINVTYKCMCVHCCMCAPTKNSSMHQGFMYLYEEHRYKMHTAKTKNSFAETIATIVIFALQEAKCHPSMGEKIEVEKQPVGTILLI